MAVVNVNFNDPFSDFIANEEDGAVLERSGLKPVANSIRQQLRAKLLSLPQGKFFRETNLNKWLDLMQDDPRAEWHAERLSGIGGSEIGILVAEKRGVPDAFGGTGYGLVLEKSMVFMPKKQTLAMRKGIFLENGIRQFFMEDYGCVRDDKAVDGLTFAERLRPWMRYSPDDVVLLGNKRYLIDYKHPNEVACDTKLAAPGISVSVAKPAIDFDLLAHAIGDDAAKNPVYDVGAIQSAMIDSGADMAPFETGKFIWNEESMLIQAEQMELDVMDYAFNKYRFLSKADKPFIETVDAMATEVVGRIPEPAVPESKKSAKPCQKAG